MINLTRITSKKHTMMRCVSSRIKSSQESVTARFKRSSDCWSASKSTLSKLLKAKKIYTKYSSENEFISYMMSKFSITVNVTKSFTTSRMKKSMHSATTLFHNGAILKSTKKFSLDFYLNYFPPF